MAKRGAAAAAFIQMHRQKGSPGVNLQGTHSAWETEEYKRTHPPVKKPNDGQSNKRRR
jgi:hypothetical protein